MTVAGRFDGKVALITGGGTGIGAAAALRIASEGGKVVVMGRREVPLRKVPRRVVVTSWWAILRPPQTSSAP